MKKKLLYLNLLLCYLGIFNYYSYAQINEDSNQNLESESGSEMDSEAEEISEPKSDSSTIEMETSAPEKNSIEKTELKKAESIPQTKVKSEKISESEIYIQESNKYKLEEQFKNLRLNDVLEQGLRKNYDIQASELKLEFEKYNFEGAQNKFYMPEIKLGLKTSSHRIANLSKSTNDTNTLSKIPSGEFGIYVSDYTLFNWGKDYNSFKVSKNNFERKSKSLDETRRNLKLDLILDYFRMVSQKQIEQIYAEELRHASFIYRLSKEKMTVGKTSKQDYYQARSEYLKAQNDFHTAKINTESLYEEISFKIGNEPGTKYRIDEDLVFKRIKVSLEDILEKSKLNNPSLLESKNSIQNAEIKLENLRKENLPLPKLSLSLGAFRKSFSEEQNSTGFVSNNYNKSIDVVASINAEWSLTGEDGLFNNNKMAKGRIELEIEKQNFLKNKSYTQSLIRQSYQKVLSLQNQILITDARIPSIKKSFDTILENYLSSKTKYNDFHLALNDLIETKVLAKKYKLEHLFEKVMLAKLAGLEDFPGENFEQLAIKNKE